MLNVLKERLLDGMEILKVKENRSKYEITFLISGGEIKVELPKTCAPGCQDIVVDQAMFLAMCNAETAKGKFDAAKDWLDKIMTRKDDAQ